MRCFVLFALLTLAFTLPAEADDSGYVVDVSQPLPEGKVYEVTDGVVKVVDLNAPLDLGPLVVVRLVSEAGGEVSLWQFHPDEKGFIVRLSGPDSPYDPTPTEGVMQITDLDAPGTHRESSPELLSLLPLGQRYVIHNIELVIYAPWCTSFQAYLLGQNEETRKYQILDLSDRPGSQSPAYSTKSKVLGWIQGSLGTTTEFPQF